MPHHGYVSQEEAVGKAVKDLEFDCLMSRGKACVICVSTSVAVV